MGRMIVEEDSPLARPFLARLIQYKYLKVIPSREQFVICGVRDKYPFLDGIISREENEQSDVLTAELAEAEATAILERLTAGVKVGDYELSEEDSATFSNQVHRLLPSGWHERRAEEYRKAMDAKAVRESAPKESEP